MVPARSSILLEPQNAVYESLNTTRTCESHNRFSDIDENNKFSLDFYYPISGFLSGPVGAWWGDAEVHNRIVPVRIRKNTVCLLWTRSRFGFLSLCICLGFSECNVNDYVYQGIPWSQIEVADNQG